MRNATKDFSLGVVPHLELLYQIRPEVYLDWFPVTDSGQMTQSDIEPLSSSFQQPDVEYSALNTK